METHEFVRDLESLRDERLRGLAGTGGVPPEERGAGEGPSAGDAVGLLQIALANEIGVSELAAAWMPATPEVDVKIALARQAGDEARHFMLVAERLRALGFDPDGFTPPGPNPLFDYLRALPTSIERIAAGLFTLESIAYDVNDRFIQLCESRGDRETARIYREHIQPDEAAHRDLGRTLLLKYATGQDARTRARSAVLRTIEIAAAQRARAAERLGTRCFPGC